MHCVPPKAGQWKLYQASLSACIKMPIHMSVPRIYSDLALV